MAPEDKTDYTILSYSLTAAFSTITILLLVGIVSWFFHGPDDLPSEKQLEQTAIVAWNFLVLSMIAGVAGMAVVEMNKYLLRSRARFHQHELFLRLGRRTVLELLGLSAPTAPETPNESEKEMEDDYRHDEVTDRELLLRMDIPLEQLIAQIATGAERGMVVPDDAEKALVSLGGLRVKRALDVIKKKSKPQRSDPDEELVNAHASLRQAIEQSLDALQIAVGSKWRYRIRVEAAMVAGLIGLSTLLFTDADVFVKLGVLVATFVWGGFFAWLARDLAAGIQRWRG